MPTTHPQISQHLVEQIDPIIFLGWRKTQRCRQHNHQRPFGVDKLTKRDGLTSPFGEGPEPSDVLIGVFRAQEGVLRPSATTARNVVSDLQAEHRMGRSVALTESQRPPSIS